MLVLLDNIKIWEYKKIFNIQIMKINIFFL